MARREPSCEKLSDAILLGYLEKRTLILIIFNTVDHNLLRSLYNELIAIDLVTCKVHNQSSDCRWPLQASSGVCVWTYTLTYGSHFTTPKGIFYNLGLESVVHFRCRKIFVNKKEASARFTQL